MKTSPKDIRLSDRNDISRLHIELLSRGMICNRRRATGQRAHDLNVTEINVLSDVRIDGSRRCDDRVVHLRFFFLDAGHGWQQPLDDRSPDENRPKRGWIRILTVLPVMPLIEKGKVEVGLEALDLTAEVIAVHAHIETTDELLAAFFRLVCRLGE